MRKLVYIFGALAILSGFSSCEDPIDLDLGAPVQQIVIDAVINQTADTQFIYIRKSLAYLDNGDYKGYQMDTVGILDTATQTFHEFTWMGDGVYFFVPPAANTFVYNQTYQFLAKDGSNTYFSQSLLNSPTTVDSFVYKYEEDGRFGGSEGNYVTLWAKDKPGQGDFYWFKLYRNDSMQNDESDINLAADNSFSPGGQGDGDLFIVPIRENFTPRPYSKGDTVRVEILSINPELYYYLDLIRTQLNNQGLFAVPSSNIPSNIICINNPDNKVLGFFSMTGLVSTQKLQIQ
jgi:hypothetical protein